MKWEHHIESFDEWNEIAIFEYLQNLGQQRWELIHVSDSLRTYFFKREVQNEKD